MRVSGSDGGEPANRFELRKSTPATRVKFIKKRRSCRHIRRFHFSCSERPDDGILVDFAWAADVR